MEKETFKSILKFVITVLSAIAAALGISAAAA